MQPARAAPDEPRLRLFGVPRLRAGATELHFAPRRPFQLLAFVACRQTWVTRAELAELFWPDRAEGAARGNLRTLLLRARELPGLDGLDLQAERVRWLPGTDLQRIEAAIAAGDDAPLLAMDGAPLLQGLEPGLPEPLLEWLTHERQRLDAAWRRAARRRLGTLAPGPAAAALAARLGDEDAAEAMLTGTVRAPDDEGFIGRKAEIAALLALLDGPARMVAVIGPGGSGKSALLRALQPLLARRGTSRVVCAVSVEALHDLIEVPARVAAALGFTLRAGADPWVALQTAVGERRLLLVLDNIEHLAGIVDRLLALLAACTGLQLLLGSRERPAGAAVLTLDGLPLPDEDDIGGSDAALGESDDSALRRFDAVRLFEARARAVATGFVLAGHGRALLHVLQATEGLPLAVELAAAATRLMPIEHVAIELGRSIDVLDAAAPAGSRGLRACFDRSWSLLGGALQDRLAALAWLPGPFGREMALAVAGAGLADLAQLVDRCLLRVAADGRLSLHPLLRQYAAERGRVDPAALGSRLAAHVGHVLAAIDRPDRLADPPTLDALDPELPHLRAAWSWAVQHGTAALLMRLTRVLGRYHVDRGRSHELLPLLDHAVHEIAAPGRSGLAARALALRTKAMLEFHRGALATAQADARQALRWASRAGEPTTACACLTVLGNALLFAGRADAARPHFELALRSAQARGEVSLAASASNGLGLVARARGDHDTALAMFKTAGAAWRDLGDVAGQLTALSNIGNIAFVRQHWADALAADQEYLAVVTRHGLAARRALAQTNLATTFIESGDLARARRHAEQAVAAMPDNGEVMPPVEARLALARIEAAEGRPAQAVTAWMQALTAARQSSSEWLLLRCSLIAGDLLAAQGSQDEAAGLWSWLLQQPQADAPLRAAAERRLQALGHAGPPPLLPQGAVDEVLGLAQQRLALKRP